MGDVDETPPRLLVSVSGLTPGAPLDAAVALADALDARRVPLTLLVGPQPHPEVAVWAAARRRAGDVALLHGTRVELPGGRPYRRLPAHEAGLRLAAALRARDALGPAVDGFAAPGWSTSPGTRGALVAAGVGLCLDDTGVHRLGVGGATVRSWHGPVATGEPRRGSRRALLTRSARRRPEPDLVHLALTATTPAPRAGALVDAALDSGATPLAATELVTRRVPRRPGAAGDPEQWSITA
jgi:predicted deacetylase